MRLRVCASIVACMLSACDATRAPLDAKGPQGDVDGARKDVGMSKKTMQAVVVRVSPEQFKNLGLVTVTFERYASGYYVDVKNPSLQKIVELLEKSRSEEHTSE